MFSLHRNRHEGMDLVARNQKDGVLGAVWKIPSSGNLSTIVDEIYVPHLKAGVRRDEAIQVVQVPILPEHSGPTANAADSSIDDDLTLRVDLKRCATGLTGRRT